MSQYNNPYAGQIFATSMPITQALQNAINQQANTGHGKYFTSTSTIGGFGGFYSPPEMDRAAVEKEANKYDGILQGYWCAMVESFDLPFLGKDVFEQARTLVGITRTPSPQNGIRVMDSQARLRDAIDELCDEVEADSFRAQALYGRMTLDQRMAQAGYDLTQQIMSAQHAMQQSLDAANAWGSGLNQTAQSQPSWFQRIFGGGGV